MKRLKALRDVIRLAFCVWLVFTLFCIRLCWEMIRPEGRMRARHQMAG
jgi:hypothetical protein